MVVWYIRENDRYEKRPMTQPPPPVCPACGCRALDYWGEATGEPLWFCCGAPLTLPVPPAPPMPPRSRALTVGAWLCLAMLFVVATVFCINLCLPLK